MPEAHVNGLRLHYEQRGEGAPLVCAHSGVSDSREWRPQLEGLADELTVVAWDEPGAGRSSTLPADFGLGDYARCLAAVIEAVGLGPAHVAGLSWGGIVAQELYRLNPGLVATLILADTYAGWKGSLSEDERQVRVQGLRAALEESSDDFRSAFPGLFAGGPPAEFVSLLDEIAADVRPESVRTLLSMADVDQRDLLPHIDVPVLLVWGELDERSPLSVARQIQAEIPSAELVVIPDAGHISNLESPERFNQALREFCRAHPPGSGSRPPRP